MSCLAQISTATIQSLQLRLKLLFRQGWEDCKSQRTRTRMEMVFSRHNRDIAPMKNQQGD